MADTHVTFGPFELDASSYRLRRDGATVPLEPKALDLLVLLVSRAPRVVDKAEIFSAIWKDVAVTDNALTRIVAQLRRGLDDDARAPRYIETVATRGYRFVADVMPVVPSPPPSVPFAAPIEGRAEASAAVATAAGAAPADTVPAGRLVDASLGDTALGNTALAATALGDAVVANTAFEDTVPAAAVSPDGHGLSGLAPTARGGVQTRRGSRALVWAVAAACAGVGLAFAAWLAQGGRDGAAPPMEAAHVALASLVPEQVTTGTGYDAFPAFSPDGQSIAFSSDASGALEIYVQALVPGATPTPLTSRGRHAVQPAWSPDGQFIAYHDMGAGGIWVVPARGGVARRIADFGSRPAWSPDGQSVAFQSMPLTDLGRLRAPGLPSTIWVVDPSGGRPRPVTVAGTPRGPHLSPAWSPDGTLLFAETALDDPTTLWRVTSAGTHLRRVMDHPRFSAEFAVDPQGRGIYFVADTVNAIWWQPFGPDGLAAGAPAPTGLSTSGTLTSKLALSPDGSGLAWASLEVTGHVWSQAVAGGAPQAPRALTEGASVRYSVPVAARDGRIAMGGVRTGAPSVLYVLDPGRGLRPATLDDHPHANPQWLPGERELAYLTDAPIPSFNAVDVETGRERPLFPLSALPLPAGLVPFGRSTFSNVVPDPAFSRVAVTLMRDGVLNIWVAGLRDGKPDGQIAQRTFETEGATFPVWSPDGRWIAYQCLDGMTTHVCVTDTQTGTRLQLTREPGQSWSGGWVDNDAILFAAQRHGVWSVMQVSRTTGLVRAITTDAGARTYARYPRWDAFGRRVLFERGELTARVFRVALPE